MGPGGKGLSQDSGGESALSGHSLPPGAAAAFQAESGAGLPGEAKKELQQELEIDPSNAGAEYVLGELARQGQDFPEAVRHFTKATELEPELCRRLPGPGHVAADREEICGGRRAAGDGGQTAARKSCGALQPGHGILRAPDAKKMRSANLLCSSRLPNAGRPTGSHRNRRSDRFHNRLRCDFAPAFSCGRWPAPLDLLDCAASLSCPRCIGVSLRRSAASASRITWVHTAGKSPQKYLPETTGAGCAFLDYDNDGWMDIYLVNSGKCDFYNPNPPLRNALYRNNRDGTFTDVTEKAGVAAGGYGQGVAVGDYDGDGFPDIYVTQYGRSILYHNNGDGTFTDVTEKAGVAAPGWASSAVWFDYDNDGRLDLFVCHFVEFNKAKNLPCTAYNKPGYCIPTLYNPMPAGSSTTTATGPSPMSARLRALGNIWARPGAWSRPT